MKTFADKGVYRLVSKTTGKCYVGSTVNRIWDRWRMHRSCLLRDIHHSIHLQRHVNKYGLEDIELEILEVEPENTIEAEKFYIDKFDSYSDGFNCIENPGDSPTGIRREFPLKEIYYRRLLGESLTNLAKEFDTYPSTITRQCQKLGLASRKEIMEDYVSRCKEEIKIYGHRKDGGVVGFFSKIPVHFSTYYRSKNVQYEN